VSINFYNNNADSFFNSTQSADLTSIYQQFLPLLEPRAHILDAGCGSGRDTKYFLKQGFQVTAFDASEMLVKKASLHTGIKVFHHTFDSFTLVNKQAFDAIWACASLLHVPSKKLTYTFKNLATHLQDRGFFYCSFKYGNDDVERDGRHFTNVNEKRLSSFIENTTLHLYRTWLSKDVRPDRQNEQWLNAILQKKLIF